MQIQLNTDHRVVGSEALAREVDAAVRGSLGRFAERITRVEVHLTEGDGARAGEDRRCQVEARLAGRNPVSADHTAPTIPLALDGALGRLLRVLERTAGRDLAGRHTKIAAPDPGEE
jgi:hypothetical protein